MYAAIGTDGNRPVVWGLGNNYEESVKDAQGQLLNCGLPSEEFENVVQVTTEQADSIRCGVVGIEDLGIILSG